MLESELRKRADAVHALAGVMDQYAPLAEKMRQILSMLDTPGRRAASAAIRPKATINTGLPSQTGQLPQKTETLAGNV